MSKSVLREHVIRWWTTARKEADILDQYGSWYRAQLTYRLVDKLADKMSSGITDARAWGEIKAWVDGCMYEVSVLDKYGKSDDAFMVERVIQSLMDALPEGAFQNE